MWLYFVPGYCNHEWILQSQLYPQQMGQVGTLLSIGWVELGWPIYQIWEFNLYTAFVWKQCSISLFSDCLASQMIQVRCSKEISKWTWLGTKQVTTDWRTECKDNCIDKQRWPKNNKIKTQISQVKWGHEQNSHRSKTWPQSRKASRH